MKFNCLFSKINYILIYTGLFLISCEKSPKLSVSLEDIIFEAMPEEAQIIDIYANVDWVATIQQDDEEWLTIDPPQGSGNGSITLTAVDNPDFFERTASIAISGDGVRTDTIKIIQVSGIDVAERIEDKIFREYCLVNFDNSPEDGLLSLQEARLAIEIVIKGKSISTLAGIEYFTKLKTLNCSNNPIENLDLSKNKELRKLDCSYNKLDHVDVSENLKLTELIVYGMDLKSVDVKKNTALLWLAISNNQIESIDVSNNKELEGLECNENLISSIDVSKNPKLLALYCSNNQLSKLDISANTVLLHLWCNSNQLTSFDLSYNTSLQTLSCTNNSIKSLNMSKNTGLTRLMCDKNTITNLDLSQNIKLTDLSCSSNQLTGVIDISKNTELKSIDFKGNDKLKTILVWPGFDVNNNNYKKDETTKYDFLN